MTRRRLLVADDEADMRSLLEFHFGNLGYEVESVADGAAALEALNSSQYDVLILDGLMPRLSGLATLAVVRRTWPTQRVVMLTSGIDVDLGDGAQLDTLGLRGWLRKPFDIDELTALVATQSEAAHASR